MKSYADESINIIKDAIPEEAKCYEWPPIGNNIDLPTLPDFPLHALPASRFAAGHTEHGR